MYVTMIIIESGARSAWLIPTGAPDNHLSYPGYSRLSGLSRISRLSGLSRLSRLSRLSGYLVYLG